MTQEQLINWGYAIADASMRRWVMPEAATIDDTYQTLLNLVDGEDSDQSTDG